MMFMPVKRIIWQCKIKWSQKILSRYEYTTVKIVVTPSFNGWAVVFLIIILCCARGMVSLLFVPTGRGTNSLQNCCPCSFCSHKQWCLTVLCELWFKVVFNSNSFFLNWKQWTAVKAVEDALQSKYQNIWSRSVSENWKGMFKNFRGTSHSTPEQGLEQ